MGLAGGDEAFPQYTPCEHLLKFRRRNGSQYFRALETCLKVGCGNRASISRARNEIPKCHLCGKSKGRLYACLTCAAIGCCEPLNGHVSAHAGNHVCSHARGKPGHELAVDIDRVELFCSMCGDQVYDADFDQVVLCHLAAARSLFGAAPSGCEDPNGTLDPVSSHAGAAGPPPPYRRRHAKRRRGGGAEYRAWEPSQRERDAIRAHATPQARRDALPLGLRGLNNLGNTCFMNSAEPRLCLGCDMDDVFAAAFSGERTPYSPAQFLYSWWRHAENLAGYEQQDAHEFFISTIDGIHAYSSAGTAPPHARGSHGGSSRVGGVGCRCIVHRVFSGLLRSDVTCTMCGFTSTTYDPCVDISLDLDLHPAAKQQQQQQQPLSASPLALTTPPPATAAADATAMLPGGAAGAGHLDAEAAQLAEQQPR
eukprot:jgi/Mesen1/10258/ME000778S09605